MQKTDSSYDPARSIHDAAHAGNLEAIERLLDEDPDRARKWGASRMQPLHYAANAAAAEALIRRGASVNAPTDRDETPLHFAARYGHLDVAEVLVRHGADLNAANNRRETPLYHAAHAPECGGHDVARFLLDRGAALELDSALALGMLDRARRFLEDPDAIRNAARPELLPGLAVWIIDCAIRERIGPTKFEIMRRRGAYELDPDVIAAVVAEHLDILEKILDRGAPMGYRSFEALVMAVELPHTAVAELLLKAGAGDPERVRPWYGMLGPRVGRSACKGPMLALLRRHGIELSATTG
jgi:hypothetical protein